jgi:hypothetical protein
MLKAEKTMQEALDRYGELFKKLTECKTEMQIIIDAYDHPIVQQHLVEVLHKQEDKDQRNDF